MSASRTTEAGALTLDSVFVASSQQVSCALADEVVVLSLENGTYYAMDPVAARIWELLAEPRSLGAIRDVIMAEFEGAEVERCTRDVHDFLGQLMEWNLVQAVPSVA